MTPSPDAERAPVDLDEDDRIEAAMTPGPWKAQRSAFFFGVHAAADMEELLTTELATSNDEANAVGIVHMRNRWPSMVAELRRLRSGVGLIACPDHGQIPDSIDPDVEPCARCGGYGAVGHEEVLAELRAARDRIAALVAALDEAADIAARGERACLDHIDRWRALAHPTEGDPAP